jgi:vitamin B12 transporter
VPLSFDIDSQDQYQMNRLYLILLGFSLAEVCLANPSSAPASAPSSQPKPPSLADEVLFVDETTVVFELPAAEKLERSAEAIDVVELKEQRGQATDMGQVLSKEEGLSVRRSGGLGAGARISLNGLVDEQIRFFIDGVPLELTSYSFGIANIPVSLIERVEVYRGVVPIRFGADALGGAINLVTNDNQASSLFSVSTQAGSFGTYRGTLIARLYQPKQKLLFDVRGFADSSQNNYRIDVEVPDELGRLQPVTVERFHDAYRAYGASAELGFLNASWAKRLLLRVYASQFEKEIQHNAAMTVPYGDAIYGETGYGATLRYEQPSLLKSKLSISLLSSVGYRQIDFRDIGGFVYGWFGEQIIERINPGEVFDAPSDQSLWQWGFFGRLTAEYKLNKTQALLVSITPYQALRTGDERLNDSPEFPDPLNALRTLQTLTGGIEHRLSAFSERLENIAFAKSFLFAASSDEFLANGEPTLREQTHRFFGFGDALRFRLFDGLWAKVSLEKAARLPGPDEIFGNGVLIVPNIDLQPELSLNKNYSVQTDSVRDSGRWRTELGFFTRESEQLIVLLGDQRSLAYQNVFGAYTSGVEASGGWTSMSGLLSAEANTTYQSVKNASSEGTFGDFDGDRIPNRPWFFANAGASARKPNLLRPKDELSIAWDARYIHSFYRSWESIGLEESKQRIPAQLINDVRLGYQAPYGPWRMLASLEAQNITNAKSFDFFGVQKPGRAFFIKITMER